MGTTHNEDGRLAASLPSFPRLFLIPAWMTRPGVMERAFRSLLIRCLGFHSVPWTTLMYVLQYTHVPGISGLDGLWPGPTRLMDVALMGSAAATLRDRIPVGVSGSTRPPAV